MNVAARTAAWSGAKLPYDSEVEYLDVTGRPRIVCDSCHHLLESAIIDIRERSLRPESITKVGHSFSFVTGGGAVDGLATGYYWKHTFADAAYNSIGLAIHGLGRTAVVTHRTIWDNPTNTLTVQVDGVEYATWTGSYPLQSRDRVLWLFDAPGQTVDAALRFYSIQVYLEQSLTFDGIPVRIGNVGAVYDKISGMIFTNSGTGTIVCGPDITT